MACLEQTKERIARLPSVIGPGAAGDFPLGHVAADVVFGTVGMKGYLRPIEDAQELVFAGVQARQEPVEGDEAGLAGENA